MTSNELNIYESFLPQYINILKQNPSKEILTKMMGIIGEHDSASIVNGKVTNGKGSDVTVLDFQKVKTVSGDVSLKPSELVETKTTFVETENGKKVCVKNLGGKEGNCDFIFICDYRPDHMKRFIIPADVFFDRALLSDINYTCQFKWDSDYIPKGKYASNTTLLMEYEIV